MKSFIGVHERLAGTPAPPDPNVVYDPTKLITGHILICGMSGTGKSHESRRLLASAARSGARIDVFDVHEELGDIPGAARAKFSQATQYGYNPLAIETDPHAGGPLRQTDFLVELIKQVSPIGIQQESVLRNLCEDTYAAAGIFQDNQPTWHRKHITEVERRRLIAAKRYDLLRGYYPTLDDLKSFAMRKLVSLTLGGDQTSVTAYSDLAKLLRKLHNANSRYNKATNDEEIGRLESSIADTKKKAIEAHTAFIEGLETGRELSDILKYKSVDVLSSVMSRLDILNSNGIFRACPPPHEGASVKVHEIKSLSTDQQILFVKLRIREIFDRAKQRGPIRDGDPPDHVIYLDEASKYFVAERDDILNVVSKEARKFGLALWCASQEPTDFPRSFLSSVGATVLTGIHNSYWRQSVGLLGASESVLSKIRPKDVIAVKFQRTRETNAPFMAVAVPNPGTVDGKRALAQERTIA
jgi:hypothetical protein